jgi:hypothetical protein
MKSSLAVVVDVIRQQPEPEQDDHGLALERKIHFIVLFAVKLAKRILRVGIRPGERPCPDAVQPNTVQSVHCV